MKPKMYSARSNSMLHDHILDGFETTNRGLERLRQDKLVTPEEYTKLLEANIRRLITRVKEFRIAEKLTCILFAVFFTWAQVNGDDMDMRRTSRHKSVRSSRARRRMEEI